MARREVNTRLKAPYLKKIWLDPEKVEGHKGYPLDIPVIAAAPFEIEFTNPVTILAGSNGSGKSTIMEAIAAICGFGEYGGTRDYQVGDDRNEQLSRFLRASWLPKVFNGFYTRAETIFSLIRQMDTYGVDTSRGITDEENYTGKTFGQMSHGEGYSAMFRNKIRNQGIYLFDEPEAALSPTKQLEFIRLIREKELTGYTQFIIATHSPLIMAYPRACVLHLTPQGLVERSFTQTENYKILVDFYADPEGFMEKLLADI